MILGIDTSNYTTSVALCDAQGKLIGEKRKILDVRPGERGLRQSEAVFQHVKNLPVLVKALCKEYPLSEKLKAVGVSVQPRPEASSYMPVFRVGQGAAEILAQTHDVPLFSFSHQENHIRSAMVGQVSTRAEWHYPILAVHFSGGTSEIVLVKPNTTGFDCKIVGKTLDLNAGQLVDRIGVALGLKFPAGRELEKMALLARAHHCIIPTRVEKGDFHFAGQENKAKAMLVEGGDAAEVAYGIFASIGRTLSRALEYLCGETKARTVLFSGGVMANSIVRETAVKRLERKADCFFADPSYATDNAVGCTLLAWEAWKGNPRD